jgi:hypothetical protein
VVESLLQDGIGVRAAAGKRQQQHDNKLPKVTLLSEK